jgi:hypothetical protein
MSITSSITKLNAQLQSVQKAIVELDKKIEQEKTLYYEEKKQLESSLYKQIEVNNINVPLLTYQPDLQKITTENLTKIINDIQ